MSDIHDNFRALMKALPSFVIKALKQHELENIDEIILDLGRHVEIRELDKSYQLETKIVGYEDLEEIVNNIGDFTDDNRAGIDRTLHRISAIRNRRGRIIGLTIRIGRAVFGGVEGIRDLLALNRSILMMGPPGIGKTTKLREIARILSNNGKRVVIIDTSNEIAGEGDIPHESIGNARRMQVSKPSLQHRVMIEAVENHMPEVIIVDEIGTELEAKAARTIAERGVQLIATAHGQTLMNLIKNPTLSDLIGGIDSVTLGDEEAKRRGSQKTILERAAEPTFDILIELKDRYELHCYKDVAKAVDRLLLDKEVFPEVRVIKSGGEVEYIQKEQAFVEEEDVDEEVAVRIFTFAINRARLEMAISANGISCQIVNTPDDATLILTTRTHFKKNQKIEQLARDHNIPVFVIKTGTDIQISKFLKHYFKVSDPVDSNDQLREVTRLVMSALEKVEKGGKAYELPSASSYIRRFEHELISEYGYRSESVGEDPYRRVKIYGKK